VGRNVRAPVLSLPTAYAAISSRHDATSHVRSFVLPPAIGFNDVCIMNAEALRLRREDAPPLSPPKALFSGSCRPSVRLCLLLIAYPLKRIEGI